MMTHQPTAHDLIKAEWTARSEFLMRWHQRMDPEMLAEWTAGMNGLAGSLSQLGVDVLPLYDAEGKRVERMDEATAYNIRNAY